MCTLRRPGAVARRIWLLRPIFVRSARGTGRLEVFLLLVLSLLVVVSVATVRPGIPVPAGSASRGGQAAPPLRGAEAFTTAILGGLVGEGVVLVVLGGVYLLRGAGGSQKRHRCRTTT
ncbi:hypothetical protein Amsp01_064050 [Amycolatopsis sp. NBRC 101858]|uniref:hypothetical protein n=1 Tax=Amycolatopsis sp. NBRC 101858 TaxID=3032200 RepID=UPI0024A0522C|nr:hypothetical protein [Amycolatopsis sp. NBRC 101858]GLY40382.1 hypothetical protein Amsp01_064050 [Amycolatopsis sp. NBRC 101858]